MSVPHAKPNGQNSPWTDCAPGEIAGLSQRLVETRRAEHVQTVRRRVGAAVAFGVLLLAVGVFTVPKFFNTMPNYGGVTCDQVLANADRFVAGQLVDPFLSQVRVHVSKCDMCRAAIAKLRHRQNTATAQVAPAWHDDFNRLLASRR